MSDLYREVILEEARNLQNQGKLEDPDFLSEEHNASCGDEISVFVKLDTESSKITQLKWQGSGCVISQVAMSLLSQKILSEGLSLKDISRLDKKTMLELIGLDKISPGREKCLMLGVQAVQGKDHLDEFRREKVFLG